VFSRLAAAVIILFWLVMTGLLVRMQCFPGASELLPVPADHLFKLAFQHEQPSDLILFQGQDRVGNFQVQPHRFPPSAGDARNQLALTGFMDLHLPGVDAHHMTLRGVFDLDDRDAVRRFELTATLPQPAPAPHWHAGAAPAPRPPSLVIVLEGEPAISRYHYVVRQGDVVDAEQTGTPAELLDLPELHDLGIDPAAIGGIFQQQAAAMEVTARRSVMHAKGEDMDTYEVSLRQSGTLQATIQLSQLGQILEVKTNAGYSLLDATLAP
jgi:hypothetical protein